MRPIPETQIIHWGLCVNPEPTMLGEIVYAEVIPSPPLFGKRDGRSFWSWIRGGRSWKEPHIRWWYEVHSVNSPKTEDNPTGMGYHYIELDGGAMTLRQAMYKASRAVSDKVYELDIEEMKKGRVAQS